jgi:hypothetical protein
MGDTQRAFGSKIQTVVGTYTAPSAPQAFIESFTHKPNLTFDQPEDLTNTRIPNLRIVAKTRFDEMTVKGRPDRVALLPFLSSGLGPAASGVYAAGGASYALASSNLSVKFAEGLNQFWSGPNFQVNTLDFEGDATNGTFMYTAGLRGPLADVTVGTPWNTAVSLPPGLVPFTPWQMSVTTAPYSNLCLKSFKIALNNNINPLFCFPLAAPTLGQLAGLAPSRFTDGKVKVSIDLVLSYVLDTNTPFYDFRHLINEAWTITCTDTTPTTGGTLVLTVPNAGLTAGELDRTGDEVRQHVSGILLLDPGTATNFSVTVT